jgi:hypothetical protein
MVVIYCSHISFCNGRDLRECSIDFLEFNFPATEIRADSVVKTRGSNILKILGKSAGLGILEGWSSQRHC